MSFDMKWLELRKLKQSLSTKKSGVTVGEYLAEVPMKVENRKEIEDAIENIFVSVLSRIAQGQPPSIEYTSRRRWDMVTYDADVGVRLNYAGNNVSKIQFASLKSVKRFALFLDILSKVYALLQMDATNTKRDIYYQDPQFYGSQEVVDNVIDDISCMLQVPRRFLHVVASAKGCIAGDIEFIDADGNYFDCSSTKSGLLIPPDVYKIRHIKSNAEVVLVIEKEATFHQILESDRSDWPSNIFITGKGFPDLVTRQMVKRLADELHIPVLALVDADPYGIEIMFTYRFGSLSCSYDCESLAVPSMRWLGLLPTDILGLHLDGTQLIPLTDSDRRKVENLLARPYCNSSVIVYQIKCLQRQCIKAEIESLSSLSPAFLTSTYIPNKLFKGSWI
ncbi:endodeoxyribonuclease [Chamberlinius hualienensis]